ncbi:hypothetical protein QBC34DRAFT_464749 [Podospora aff. communis PSN243]|uniref:Uncharacterized protein n=1 Tax=Podospora aff. communis PSN243 TaxID=3040156 RepID=A0AAV9H2P6_9PEZI|nr:hypothetical protein QBC34DRAFT_464749 [Podospora aff. communis PSN243]
MRATQSHPLEIKNGHRSTIESPKLTSEHPVSWQAAWWALVPLSIAAMTQPCGRVLGSDSPNLRFYIRASPITCALDCVHFLGVLLLGCSPDWRLFSRNIKYELNRRFRGDPFNHDSSSAQDSRTMKLVAMQGIPWTKAWTLMFFVSVAMGEILGILAERYSVSDPGASCFS